MSKSLNPPTRILKVYIDLAGFSHIFSPDSLNHTLVSQGFSFEKGSHCGDREGNIYSKDRGGSKENKKLYPWPLILESIETYTRAKEMQLISATSHTG